MRRSLRGAVGLAAVGLLALAALPSGAAPAAERSLLGIKIWRSWREVLAKYGKPTRIEIGAVTGAVGGAQQNAMGGRMGMAGMPGMMGGRFGMPGMMGPMSGGGAPTLPGMPGMGMGGAMGPMGPMGPMGGMVPGMPGGPSGGAYGPQGIGGAGKAGAEGDEGPMLPGRGAMGGMPGGARGMGMMGGPMSGGMPGGPMMGGIPGMGPMGMMGPGGRGNFGGMAGSSQAAISEPEITWVYEKGSNTNYFLFNKDGRVIQIQSFGYKGGGVTARGLALGAPVSQVYRLYGWPDSTSRAGDNLTLDYSQKAHAAFQLTDLHDGKGMRLIGITVALTEKTGI